jgi:hypothetical protein
MIPTQEGDLKMSKSNIALDGKPKNLSTAEPHPGMSHQRKGVTIIGATKTEVARTLGADPLAIETIPPKRIQDGVAPIHPGMDRTMNDAAGDLHSRPHPLTVHPEIGGEVLAEAEQGASTERPRLWPKGQ